MLKESEKIKASFELGHVDGIGVGKYAEAIPLRQALKKCAVQEGGGIEHAIPYIAELFKCKIHSESPADVQLPVARRHAAFLPIAPSRIVFDGGPGFWWRERNSSCERAHRTSDVEPHQHTANIKNDGANFLGCQGFQWLRLFQLPEVLLRNYFSLRGVREEC